MPLFLAFILFPEDILTVLFGSAYRDAVGTLQILSIGFIINALLGPNGNTLLVTGNTRFLLVSVLIAGILNVVLNVTLIPKMGIEGAAIATAASLGMKNVLWTAKLLTVSGVHPFSRNYLKPILLTACLALALYFGVESAVSDVPVWLLVLFLLVLVTLYPLSIIITRSIDQADISMLLAIEKKSGLNLDWLKRQVKRLK